MFNTAAATSGAAWTPFAGDYATQARPYGPTLAAATVALLFWRAPIT